MSWLWHFGDHFGTETFVTKCLCSQRKWDPFEHPWIIDKMRGRGHKTTTEFNLLRQVMVQYLLLVFLAYGSTVTALSFLPSTSKARGCVQFWLLIPSSKPLHYWILKVVWSTNLRYLPQVARLVFHVFQSNNYIRKIKKNAIRKFN